MRSGLWATDASSNTNAAEERSTTMKRWDRHRGGCLIWVFLTGSEGKKRGSLRKEEPKGGKGRRRVSEMDFCPKCETRLTLIKNGRSKAVLMFSCKRCGYKRRPSGLTPAIFEEIDHSVREGVVIIGKDIQKLRTFPTTRIQTRRCGNQLAYTWIVQTRELDKSATQFFRCTKCNYTFREYS